MENFMEMNFKSTSANESFARICVAAFAAQLDPSVADISDIKTAVSEAVTNAIIHGYENGAGIINIKCEIIDDTIHIHISDSGKGIEDIEQARQPLYTSKPELERSGMGFTVMESFMDDVEVISKKGYGTRIIMCKKIGR